MSKKASQRVARLVLTAAVCTAWPSAAPLAQSPTALSPSPAKRLSRSEHLQEWLAAIDRHGPGRGDEAMGVFDSWRSDDFQYLTIDIDTLFLVMADPGLRTFYWKQEGRPTPIHVVYSGPDLRLIVELAKAARDRSGEDTSATPEKRFQRNRNHVLKRGAVLHTDLAIDALIGDRTRGRGGPPGLQEFTLRLPDGRSQGLTADVGHWEFARALLDKVVPVAARDEFVRQWYGTTAAYLEAIGQLTPTHFNRGLKLFSDDAELLFYAGCLHESQAEPRIQEAMQSAVVPTGINFEVASRRTELRDAESMFRRALKSQPDHLEARIRLGRVLGLRGEHMEADMVLRTAVADAKEPLLQYYAQLFLGAEREALGDREQARDLYARAAVLYPEAQSPRLALSLLSTGDGNHTEAFGAMSPVLALPGDSRMDPWWHYHVAQGRHAVEDLTALYDRFLVEDRR